MHALIEKIAGKKEKKGKIEKRARLTETLEKLGMKMPSVKGVKAGAKKALKYGKWGGIGLGVYLTLKALEGASEAKREAAQRRW